MGRVDQGADEGGGGDQVYFVLCDVGGGGGREFYDALIFFFSSFFRYSFSFLTIFLSLSDSRQRRVVFILFSGPCTLSHRAPNPPLDFSGFSSSLSSSLFIAILLWILLL